MTPPLAPSSPGEFADIVRSTPRLLAVGSGSKPRLSQTDAVRVSTKNLHSIVEYDPGEFTITAQAGIPLRVLVDTLAEKGQRLPFDPVMVEAGGTLGGTVAAGLSGPGRFRFGGIRDFILGVRFIDGSGRILRLGGKVVKNAAGFDLPKFLVGSLGRFGALVELTFKVFPAPEATRTLRLDARDASEAARLLAALSNTRWEPDALDIPPGGFNLCVRLAGPSPALDALANDILARFPGNAIGDAAAASLWRGLREFAWAQPGGILAKAALTPRDYPALEPIIRGIPGAAIHLSSGGNVAFISLPKGSDASALDEELKSRNLSGVTLRGNAPLWLGFANRPAIANAEKQALDPAGRFPGLDD